jgi:hypothetical protein
MQSLLFRDSQSGQIVREPIIVPQSARSGQSALPETNRDGDCGGRRDLVQSSVESSIEF